MKNVVLIAFIAFGLGIPRISLALVCSGPGTTLTWATDQCLLETGEDDPNSKSVLACLSKANTIRQPCEWNATYKEKYCETLIAKGKFQGSREQCAKDPATIGPTVRELVRSQKRET